MKELTLSVNTLAGEDKVNNVSLIAKFDSHAEAVAFHDVLARACREASLPSPSTPGSRWLTKMLPAPRN